MSTNATYIRAKPSKFIHLDTRFLEGRVCKRENGESDPSANKCEIISRN